VNETNRGRALGGRQPLQRSTQLEAYAATATQVDGTAHAPHSHSIATNGGNGTILVGCGVYIANGEITVVQDFR
jgi:hypothetical protein